MLNRTSVNPRVAIVLATYNGANWVGEQLASISSQLHKDWHLFIRDDGSTDATITIIKSLVSPDRVTFLDSSGGTTGSPAANFIKALCAVDYSSFDYLAFADQDDIWVPNRLGRAIEKMQACSADGYSSDLIAFDNSLRRSWYVDKSQPSCEFDYLFQGASAGCTYMLSRRAVTLISKVLRPYASEFPPNRSHDWLIYAIGRSHGLTWFGDTEASVFYRQHSRNSYGALPSVKGLTFRLQLARSGWYREHVLWLRNVLRLTPEEREILSLVDRLRIRDRVALVLRTGQFRRKRKDQWLFAIAVLLGWF
jgi:rhamnosyltransferase